MATTSNIAYGSRGDDVKALQQNLIDLGYEELLGKGGADGIFGKDTKAAVEAYQQANGLTVDGIVGVNTSAALKNSLAANQTTPADTVTTPASTTPVTTTPAATQTPATTTPVTQNAATQNASVQTQSGAAVPNIDGTVKSADISAFVKYLNDWWESAKTQQNLAIDYATGTAINDLTRAEEDAAATFQEQRNQIAVDEAKSKDNQALYAERRGDRGGVGAAQYDSIMNAAAKNRLAVNNAQTKLATDTARQIADLRAQGEFKKADALLNLTQQYLSQIISLEQWSREFGMSEAEFRVNLEKWKAEFEAELAGITGYYKGNMTLAYQQYLDSQTAAQKQQLAQNGWTLLQAGVRPSESQIEAMDLDASQVDSLLTYYQTLGKVNEDVDSYVQKMLDFKDDGKALTYLSGLGLTNEVHNQLWAMYEAQKGTSASDEVDFKTYEDAVKYLKAEGLTESDYAGQLLTEAQWNRLKDSYPDPDTKKAYTSYEEYLVSTILKILGM